MTSKWDGVQASFRRGHRDLFGQSTYRVEFYNHSLGTYDPQAGEMTGQTRSIIASENVELVPPAMDSTVDTDGTSFDWDSSIRFPLEQDDLTVGPNETVTITAGETESYQSVTVDSGGTLVIEGTLIAETLTDNGTVTINGTLTVLNTGFIDALTPLGVENKKPTEVEIMDDTDQSETVYELHSYSYEKGSGFVMARVVEQ